jgi:nickel-type superoxide dismutase maturation protease
MTPGPGHRRRSRWGRSLAALAIGVFVGLYRPLRRVEVVGASMAPALLGGDRLVVVRLPWAPPFGPRPGQVVALRDPRRPDRVLIKRIGSVDRRRRVVEVVGDATEASTDSRSFGTVPRAAIVGRAVYRYAPTERSGPVPGPGEYDRP